MIYKTVSQVMIFSKKYENYCYDYNCVLMKINRDI